MCSSTLRRGLFSASVVMSTFAVSGFAQSNPILHELHRMLPMDDVIPLLGDLDGDGDADFLLRKNSGELTTLANDGDGRFTTTEQVLGYYQFGGKDQVLADFDGDGDLDVDMVWLGSATEYDCTPGAHALYLNDGAGNFISAPPAQLPDQGQSRSDVEAGDFDRDGDLDLLVAGRSIVCDGGGPYDAFDRVLINNGTGWFQAAPLAFSSTAAYTSGVAWGDIDGDGDFDVLICSDFGTRLWRNDGAQSFVDVSPQLPQSVLIRDAEFGDLDADGDLDAIAWNTWYPFLWLNDGAGSFVVAGPLTTSNVSTADVALVDIDGDGDLDLALACSDHDRIFLNDGSAGFSDATATYLPPPTSRSDRIALSDIDGDGDVDGLFRQASSGDPLRWNDGHEDLLTTPVPRLEFAPSGDRQHQLRDIDGNGTIDVVGIEPYGSPIHILRSDGYGGLSRDMSAFPSFVGSPAALELADFDRDGDLDVVVANWSTFQGGNAFDSMFANQGNGTFSDVSYQLPFVSDITNDFASGDVDGDGDLDLLLGTRAAPNRLYLGDGQGHFVDATPALPLGGPGPQVVLLGDVDGDGDLDAYIGRAMHQLLLNDGTGSFAPSPIALPAPSWPPICAEFGDLDGDGDLDLVIGSALTESSPHLVNVLHNDGAGVFSDASGGIAVQEPGYVNRVQLQDLDGDGDLDILATQNYLSALLLNDGTGHFSDGSSLVESGYRAVIALDFDGDADVDAIDWQGELLTNTLRQVAWRQIPRIGRELDLDVFGPPNGHFILVGARDPLSSTQTPFGALGVFRPSVFRVDFGALDAAGHGSVRIAVPANPALIGQDYFWQALVGRPARLTNVERTTFSAL